MRKQKIKDRNHIAQKELHNLFEYNDGEFYWKVKPSTKIMIGSRAGHQRHKGYKTLVINRKSYLFHRLVFLYHCGYLPTYIDHIDRDKSNNRIENLREASASLNRFNSSLRKDNKSGTTGVRRVKNKWCVTYGRNWYGSYENINDAIKRRLEVESELNL